MKTIEKIKINTAIKFPYTLIQDAIWKYGAQRYTVDFQATNGHVPYIEINHFEKTLTFVVPR